MYKPLKPRREPTNNMVNQDFQDVTQYCRECTVMSEAIKAGIGKFNLADLRNTCRYCKTGITGIFKADAIYTAIKLAKQFRNGNKGKKSTMNKKYGHTIVNLRKKGYTIKSIADTIKISINSVRRVLAENNMLPKK